MRTLKISNCPLDTHHEQMQLFFESCGSILTFESFPRSDKESTTIHVTFATSIEAKTASLMNGQILGSRKLDIRMLHESPTTASNYDKTIKIDNIDETYTPDMLCKFYSIAGAINFLTKETPNSAIISFDNHNSIPRALSITHNLSNDIEISIIPNYALPIALNNEPESPKTKEKKKANDAADPGFDENLDRMLDEILATSSDFTQKEDNVPQPFPPPPSTQISGGKKGKKNKELKPYNPLKWVKVESTTTTQQTQQTQQTADTGQEYLSIQKSYESRDQSSAQYLEYNPDSNNKAYNNKSYKKQPENPYDNVRVRHDNDQFADRRNEYNINIHIEEKRYDKNEANKKRLSRSIEDVDRKNFPNYGHSKKQGNPHSPFRQKTFNNNSQGAKNTIAEYIEDLKESWGQGDKSVEHEQRKVMDPRHGNNRNTSQHRRCSATRVRSPANSRYDPFEPPQSPEVTRPNYFQQEDNVPRSPIPERCERRAYNERISTSSRRRSPEPVKYSPPEYPESPTDEDVFIRHPEVRDPRKRSFSSDRNQIGQIREVGERYDPRVPKFPPPLIEIVFRRGDISRLNIPAEPEEPEIDPLVPKSPVDEIDERYIRQISPRRIPPPPIQEYRRSPSPQYLRERSHERERYSPLQVRHRNTIDNHHFSREEMYRRERIEEKIFIRNDCREYDDYPPVREVQEEPMFEIYTPAPRNETEEEEDLRLKLLTRKRSRKSDSNVDLRVSLRSRHDDDRSRSPYRRSISPQQYYDRAGPSSPIYSRSPPPSLTEYFAYSAVEERPFRMSTSPPTAGRRSRSRSQSRRRSPIRQDERQRIIFSRSRSRSPSRPRSPKVSKFLPKNKKMRARLNDNVPAKSIYFDNFPAGTTKANLINIFKKHGYVQETKIYSVKALNLCRGYIQFPNNKCAKSACEENHRIWKGNRVRVFLSNCQPREIEGYSVVVHFKGEITAEDLYDRLSEAGEIETIWTDHKDGIVYAVCNYKNIGCTKKAVEIEHIGKKPILVVEYHNDDK